MEERLSDILNTFEQALIDNNDHSMTDFELRYKYIDLKYDFVKLLIMALIDCGHGETFDFNKFQEKVKATSPMLEYEPGANFDMANGKPHPDFVKGKK